MWSARSVSRHAHVPWLLIPLLYTDWPGSVLSSPAKVLAICAAAYCRADAILTLEVWQKIDVIWIRRPRRRLTKYCRGMTRPDVYLLALMCTSSLGVLPYATHRLHLGRNRGRANFARPLLFRPQINLLGGLLSLPAPAERVVDRASVAHLLLPGQHSPEHRGRRPDEGRGVIAPRRRGSPLRGVRLPTSGSITEQVLKNGVPQSVGHEGGSHD